MIALCLMNTDLFPHSVAEPVEALGEKKGEGPLPEFHDCLYTW
jgi:hypothetical protein